VDWVKRVRYTQFPKDAIQCGYRYVHQAFLLVENFSVLRMWDLGCRRRCLVKNGNLDTARVELPKRLAKKYSLDINVDAIVEELPVGFATAS